MVHGVYSGPPVATFSCTDIFGNEGGDWTGSIADQLGVNGNISLDPLFVNAKHGNFRLKAESPCAPFTPPNEECDLIGAWPVGDGDDDMDRNDADRVLVSLPGHIDGGARLQFALVQTAVVQITIHDVSGRAVRRLVDGSLGAGDHDVVWDGRTNEGQRVGAGVFFCQLRVDGRTSATKKVVILK